MTEDLMVRAVEPVDKPWGHEEIFAVVEGSSVGRTLHVSAGQELSLQWHQRKDETLTVVSGRVETDLGSSTHDPRAVVVAVGETVRATMGSAIGSGPYPTTPLIDASNADGVAPGRGAG